MYNMHIKTKTSSSTFILKNLLYIEAVNIR